VSSAATPTRAPVLSSIDRIRFAKSLVDPGALAARKTRFKCNARIPFASTVNRNLVINRIVRYASRRHALRLPSMVRGMAFLHRNENSAACGANFSASTECSFDGCTVITNLHNLGREKNGVVRRCRPQQFDGVFCGDCARRATFACAFHQMIGCRPVAMTIEQCADDPAVQDSLERFVFFLRFPLSDDFASCLRFIGVLQETTNMQAIRVCRAATEAHVSWCIFFL
jgi:hypothetical protein